MVFTTLFTEIPDLVLTVGQVETFKTLSKTEPLSHETLPKPLSFLLLLGATLRHSCKLAGLSWMYRIGILLRVLIPGDMADFDSFTCSHRGVNPRRTQTWMCKEFGNNMIADLLHYSTVSTLFCKRRPASTLCYEVS